MMIELMYLENPNLFEASAVITATGSDDKGFYLTLDRSLFYPQGGGQPADQGKIFVDQDTYGVRDVRNVEGEIRHYLDVECPANKKDTTIKMVVDQDRRGINTRYHTAAHLMAAIAEKLFPEIKALKGHQFPGEAYVEFSKILVDESDFIEKLQSELSKQLDSDITVETKELTSEEAEKLIKDLPYELPKNKALRVCCIHGFTPVPCGGTHVYSLREIGAVLITKHKTKKGKTKLYYEVKAA